MSRFRVLYAARQRTACFAETLASFRPSLDLLATTGDSIDIAAEVPPGFLRTRATASFHLRRARWLDVRRFDVLEVLRTAFGTGLVDYGLVDVDLGGVCGPQRGFTQAVAAWAYEHSYQGIVYASRFGVSFECWAIFDTAHIEPVGAVAPLALDDPDLLAVAQVFALHLPSAL